MSVELIDLHPAPADLHRLVESGLAQQPKQLPAWLLYDAEGSRLFAEICEQPEYSLTRTEITLLEQRATEIASAVGEGVVVESRRAMRISRVSHENDCKAAVSNGSTLRVGYRRAGALRGAWQ